MDALRDLLKREGSEVPLDLAALELSRIEFPQLVVDPFLDILDSYASEVSAKVHAAKDAKGRLRILNEFFFGEQGFAGNENDYYNPRNSCLNEVIVSRKGIPISLSVVYICIGRRLQMPITGVGLPGHFLVRFDDDRYQTFVDVFNGGHIIDASQCLDLARQMTGMDFASTPEILDPVSNRQILVRMLNNLRSIYLRAKEYSKAEQVLNLLLDASPRDADSYVLRGAVHVELQHYQAAKADFEQYLVLAPDAQDRKRIEDQIAALNRYLIRLHSD